MEQLLQLLDPGFFFISFVFSNDVIHWVFMSHSELLQFLVAFDEERTLPVSCSVAVALAPPTLHHLHFLSQRHPQALGGGVCQETPGCFISWLSRNAVLWFFLTLLNESWWRFLIECLYVFQFLDFLVEFFYMCLEFPQILFCTLVSLVFSSVLLLSCSLSARHGFDIDKLCPRKIINLLIMSHSRIIYLR